MSHDPATVIVSSLNTAEEAEQKVREGFSDHPFCDFVLVRVSGAPIEFGCPCALHRETEWVDANWLRLLYFFRRGLPHKSDVLKKHTFQCWEFERLHRLRIDLGIANEKGNVE